MKNLSFAIEIILALFSFIIAKINKFMIGNLYTIYLIFNQKKANQWRVIDLNMVNSNLNLAVLMTKAPRWNTHAIIGTLGSFAVENSLSFDVQSAHNSAQSWIAIFYDFPNYKTITTIESNQNNLSQDWHSIKLKKGKYSIGLRYYNYGQNLTLPAIKIDDQILTNNQKIPSNSNSFYDDLINRKNFYFLAIHYYIYTLLKLRKYLPESFVQNEFLPVGATDTKFFYDCLDINELLLIETDQFTLDKYNIYVTLYDRCSLPVSSFQVTNIKQKSSPLTNNGYYLIRVKYKYKCDDKFEDINIKLTKEI